MTTEIRVPIKVTGWIVLKDLRIDHIEIDRNDWAYAPLPFTSDYGEDPDVIVFRDGVDPRMDRFEADVNITEPVHAFIDASDVGAFRWITGGLLLEGGHNE